MPRKPSCTCAHSMLQLVLQLPFLACAQPLHLRPLSQGNQQEACPVCLRASSPQGCPPFPRGQQAPQHPALPPPPPAQPRPPPHLSCSSSSSSSSQAPPCHGCPQGQQAACPASPLAKPARAAPPHPSRPQRPPRLPSRLLAQQASLLYPPGQLQGQGVHPRLHLPPDQHSLLGSHPPSSRPRLLIAPPSRPLLPRHLQLQQRASWIPRRIGSKSLVEQLQQHASALGALSAQLLTRPWPALLDLPAARSCAQVNAGTYSHARRHAMHTLQWVWGACTHPGHASVSLSACQG